MSIHVSLCASDGASERVGEGRKLEVVYRKIGKGDGVDRGWTESVWPDVEVKSRLNVSKRYPRSSHIIFTEE